MKTLILVFALFPMPAVAQLSNTFHFDAHQLSVSKCCDGDLCWAPPDQRTCRIEDEDKCRSPLRWLEHFFRHDALCYTP